MRRRIIRSHSSMSINLSDDARTQSISSIKRYFAEELELDIGELKADMFLEFVLKEIAPSVYNEAIADAQAYLRERLIDLDGVCSATEFGYWSSSSVRQASR